MNTLVTKNNEKSRIINAFFFFFSEMMNWDCRVRI
jgi:hypothetical protein